MSNMCRPIPLRHGKHRKAKVLSLYLVRGLHEKLERPHIPWIQNYPDAGKQDPFLHQLVGTILLKKVVKNLSGHTFNNQEFGRGVQHAITTVIRQVPCCHHSESLARFLGAELYQYIRKSLDALAVHNRVFHLDVKDIGDWRITGVRTVFGASDPRDEHVVSFLGQHMITSKSVLEEVALSEGFGFKQILDVFSEGKKLGQDSFSQGVRFQVNVCFRSFERAFIAENNENSQSATSHDFKNVLHNWLFESPVTVKENVYPLNWKIVDMDNVCRWKKAPS